MWLYVDFEPLTAFGLRPSNTTANGGKTLLSPTPYAIKMAILDRLLRFGGEGYGRERFPAVRDLHLWIRVPLAVAVNRTFQKVQRAGTKKTDYWISTISQREYCFHGGVFTFAFSGDARLLEELPKVMSSINYFGRKGSFMQFIGTAPHRPEPKIGDGFVDVCSPAEPSQLSLHGFLQRMDDMRPDATFEDVSVYAAKSRSHDGGRIYHNVIFPYQIDHHGYNHTVYKRNTG
jgi:hypothetical protein